MRVAQENTGKPSRIFLGHFAQRQEVARASWASYLKVITVELIEIEQPRC